MSKSEHQTNKINNVYRPDESIEELNKKPNKLSQKAISIILLTSLVVGGYLIKDKITSDDKDNPQPKPYTVDTVGGEVDTWNKHIEFSGEQTVTVKEGEGMNNLIYDIDFDGTVGSQNYDAIIDYIEETNPNIVDKQTDQINLQAGTKVHLPATGHVETKPITK